MTVRDNTGYKALRTYSFSNGKLSKSLEKLSTGYRINRAADGAAELAISEKMRANITGLGRAMLNSKEGIGLVQTGEGALEEIHQMLRRAVELATQSANGTYNDELDRESLQRELDQLCGEIDRIAQDARFNTIPLFQNKGFEYESAEAAEQYNQTLHLTETEGTADTRNLSELLGDQKSDSKVNLVYLEHDKVTTTPNTSGAGSGLAGLDRTIGGKLLSNILKEEIIPQTVENMLRNYPAFSYLKGSTIGMGLKFESVGASGGSMRLASVGLSYSRNGGDELGYTLTVNVKALEHITTRDGLEDLEATISHEMIHAFMDEALTAGMSGTTYNDPDHFVNTPGHATWNSAHEFPKWFIEGMAQTASGPDNWLQDIHPATAASDLQAMLASNGLGSDTTKSQYGTGYLACMYLGQVISNGGVPGGTVTSSGLKNGLNKLLGDMIGGKSLDAAIKDNTNYGGLSDFVTKFNSCPADVSAFTASLLAATGSGRGGLISGDLAANDLTPNGALSGVKLFELDTAHGRVMNKYPSDYSIYSGGTTNTPGIEPGDYTKSFDAGDFVITGVPDSSITYDSTNGTVTVRAGGDVRIKMKNPGGAQSAQTLIIDSANTGSVALDGVQCAGLTVNPPSTTGRQAEISFAEDSRLDQITLGAGTDVKFHGDGTLNVGALAANSGDTIRFEGGAVLFDDPTATYFTGTAVVIDNTFTNANFTGASGIKNTAGNAVEAISPQGGSPNFAAFASGEIRSFTIDGRTYSVSLPGSKAGNFWLDPGTTHRVTLTGTDGGSPARQIQKTLVASIPSGGAQLQWQEPLKPFVVTGGTEGTDWEWAGNDGNTLRILSSTSITISDANKTDETGGTLIGRIEVADGVGAVDITLNGVSCTMTDPNASAFDLGKGNNVTLNLPDNITNTLIGGLTGAGIAVGDGTNLTINGGTGSVLNAFGGASRADIPNTNGTSRGAGIGRIGESTDMTSSITINGGTIYATGGYYSAGIGATERGSFGDIEIQGGATVISNGGYGAAGIGGAIYADVGNITIDGSNVTAHSKGHGAGIGGGWSGTTNGTITIGGASTVNASSLEHGTGIGAGCGSSSGKVTIGDSANVTAQGGNDGAGIGASWTGSCASVEISGSASVTAIGGNRGAGIGSGSQGSRIGSVLIDTEGTVKATGGQNGVGIGSGYSGSSVGNIWIKKGTVSAIGSTDSTGIGAGRSSTGGNIQIGDPNDDNAKVRVTADGGMTNDGGNIQTGSGAKLSIYGTNTSVKTGETGEGRYHTSGAVDENGVPLYAYPLYLFGAASGTLSEAGKDAVNFGNDASGKPLFPLPVNAKNIQISIDGKAFTMDLDHKPADNNYVYLWLTGKDHTISLTYEDGAGNTISVVPEKKLTFYGGNAGKFRFGSTPSEDKKPEYVVDPDPSDPSDPSDTPDTPDTPVQPDPPTPSEPQPIYARGIILQIGAEYGETLEIPQFYLSAEALKIDGLDISTQENAQRSMSVIYDAINRVSDIRGTYGAHQNRLEHNINSLNVSVENNTDAESRIRDVDMAKEYMEYVKSSIQSQAAQAMAAHWKQNANMVMQLFQ